MASIPKLMVQLILSNHLSTPSQLWFCVPCSFLDYSRLNHSFYNFFYAPLKQRRALCSDWTKDKISLNEFFRTAASLDISYLCTSHVMLIWNHDLLLIWILLLMLSCLSDAALLWVCIHLSMHYFWH